MLHNGRFAGMVSCGFNNENLIEMKIQIENLKAQMQGIKLNIYQRADALIEFNKLLDYVEELEQLTIPAVSGSLPFTDDELLEMESKPFPTQLWQKAFNFYNSDKNNQRLSMSCRPCFNKVMIYLLKIRFRQ